MKPFFTIFCITASFFALLLHASVSLAGPTVTLFLDGAAVEHNESARKGLIEIILPPSALTDSLKIKPRPGTTINRVVVTPRQPSKSRDQELSSILERQDLLHDRIKALSVREEIFKSAAKSQSGKAPRKTKSNPEPIAGIRQGTDYAIAQLEAVYTAKRKAEKELKLLEEKRSNLARDNRSAGNNVKLWVTPVNGTVIASWNQTDRNWTPSYELRVDTPDTFRLNLIPGEFLKSKGEKVSLELASLATPPSSPGFRFAAESGAVRLEALKLSRLPGDTSLFPTVLIVSESKNSFPAGDVSCYRNGEYLGTGKFPGLEAGKSLEFRCLNR